MKRLGRRARRHADKPLPENIASWVKDHMEVLSKSGGELVCRCPFCNSDRFYVNPKEAVYVCFRCWESGTTTKLVKVRTPGMGWKAAEALLRQGEADDDELEELLRVRPGGDVARGERYKVRHILPAEFVPCFDGEHWRVPKYLTRPMPKGRELCAEDITGAALGYCKLGRYRDRVIIPIACDGHHTYLGRLMGRESDFAWTAEGGRRVVPPKYLMPKGAGLPQVLYGYDQVTQGAEVIYIVEGVFDRIRMVALGYRNVVASLGKKLTDEQVELLRRRKPRSICVIYDAGSGYISAVEVAVATRRRLQVVSTVVRLPADDPDELGARDPEGLAAAIAAASLPVEEDALLLALADSPAPGAPTIRRARKRQ